MQSSYHWLSRFFHELGNRSGRAQAAKSIRSGRVAQRGFASPAAGPSRVEKGSHARRGRRRRRPPTLRVRQTLQPFWYRS